MKCDRCENEATVHEVRIESGKRREKHLCEQCARSEGVAPQAQAPITALLSQFMTQANPGAAGAGAEPAPAAAARTAPCPGCGTTYNQFRQSGLLGCPKCYEVFETQLSPLIARAHEGGTRHVGKTPKPIRGVEAVGGKSGVGVMPAPVPVAPKVDAAAVAARVAQLKKRLNEAVAAEEYEKAAKLRDEMARLQNPTPTPPVPSTPPAAQAATPPAAPAPTHAPAPKRKPKATGEEGKS